MTDAAIAFLLAKQNFDGGWGYNPQQVSWVEPTAATILALRGNSAAMSAIGRGLKWLHENQHSDGGWGTTIEDRKSGWATAWAIIALSSLSEEQGAVVRGTEWLLQVPTLEPTEDQMQILEPTLDIDLSLRGWPWHPGEATWIEPTALTMLAATASKGGGFAEARLQEAVRYVIDRRCRGGGWNVGSPVMFSQPLPPRAHPTAWALLALAYTDPHAIISEDLLVMRSTMMQDGGALALAWGLLALHALDQDDSAAAQRLTALQQSDGSWDSNPYHTAGAMLALNARTIL